MAVISLITIGSLIFFSAKSSSEKSNSSNESQSGLEEKFRLEAFEISKGVVFYNWEKKKGFRISWEHPALKGVELKAHNFYLIKGIKKPLNHTTKTKIDMSDKITIAPC